MQSMMISDGSGDEIERKVDKGKKCIKLDQQETLKLWCSPWIAGQVVLPSERNRF